MKMFFNPLGSAAKVLAGVALAGFAAGAYAQVRPAHQSETPDFDQRAAAAKSPERLAQRDTGVSGLKHLLSGADVSFDRLTDSPRFIHSRTGFLTGPNGVGLAVRPQTAQA